MIEIAPTPLARYSAVHASRANLLLHAVTVPIFCAGTVAVLAAPFASAWLALGAVGMLAALAAQGRGHRAEPNRPAPFRGPGDFVARIFFEQWVTFPRYVLSGGFACAWRRRAVVADATPAHVSSRQRARVV
jgi:hypothetical protein